jgi:hypothetical protein
MEDKIEHKFSYKNFKCVITYRQDKQFGGFCPNKISVSTNKIEKVHAFNELRILRTEEECKDFLVYQTEKFIDNNFKLGPEFILAYFLKTNSGLSVDQQKKIFDFFVQTKQRFENQSKELDSTEDKNKYIEIYGLVREEMLSLKNLKTIHI